MLSMAETRVASMYAILDTGISLMTAVNTIWYDQISIARCVMTQPEISSHSMKMGADVHGVMAQVFQQRFKKP
jgi:hypothetical protein